MHFLTSPFYFSMKTCNKCKLEQPLKNFSKLKSSKDSLQYQCKSCQRCYDDLNKEKKKQYYLNNMDSKKEKQKKYILDNWEKQKLYQKQYILNNIEKLRIYRKQYNFENRERRRLYEIEKYHNDPIFKLKNLISTHIYSSLTRNNYKKSIKTEYILGCTIKEFKLYLESKFELWMTWDNHGKYNGELNYGWDLDHIIPISSAKTKEEIYKLNHFSNLQPLCSKINRDIKKSNIINN